MIFRFYYIVIFFGFATGLQAQSVGKKYEVNPRQHIVSAISSNGQYIATASYDGRVSLWSQSYQLLQRINVSNERVLALDMSPSNSRWLAYGSREHELVIYDIEKRQEVYRFKGHQNLIFKIAFSPSGNYIASASADHTVKIWDVRNSQMVADLSHEGRVLSLAWHPQEEYLVSGANNKIIYQWDLRTYRLQRRFHGHTGPITALAYHPNGSMMLSGSLDGKLIIWDANSGDFIYRFDDHKLGITDFQFYENYLFSSSSDGFARLYDIEKKELLQSIDMQMGWLIALAPDRLRQQLLIGGQYGILAAVPIEDFISLKPKSPVFLELSAVSFYNKKGQALLAGIDEGEISFTITNNSNEMAYEVEAKTEMLKNTKAVSYPQAVRVGNIGAQEQKRVRIPVSTDERLQNGQLYFRISFSERNGFEPHPIEIDVKTVAYQPPRVMLADFSFVNEFGEALKAGEVASLQVLIQNQGQGKADSVYLDVALQENVFPAEQTHFYLGQLAPGQSRLISFDFFINRRFEEEEVRIGLDIREKYGKFGQKGTAKVKVNQALPTRVNYSFNDDYRHEEVKIDQASLYSAVDRNIPLSDQLFKNRFALVIGNEDYAGRQPHLSIGANVPYAVHDARVFATYAHRVLGVPEEQVFLITNATSGEMQREIQLMEQVIRQMNGNAEVYVYYAGHGYPDVESKQAYLMPVDVSHGNLQAAVSLQDLYYSLSKYESQHVTMFLDACFSGGGREEGLVAARNVRIEPKADFVPGRLVVFAAASGNQLAFPNHQEKHGLFTYHVLKKLQETAGKISYLQLARYLEEEVSLDAIRIKKAIQNPEVLSGNEIRDDWDQLIFMN